MTLKHVLKLFSKTEVQEDKTHPNPPLEMEGVKVSCAKHIVKDFSSFTSHFSQLCTPHPSPLPQGAREQLSCAEYTVKNLSSNRPIVLTTLKKAAFTLAEVLITLGIIGVVAALTLPTLIANHKKQTYVNQLKKVVNTLENAAQMAVADEGVSSFKDTTLYNSMMWLYGCIGLPTCEHEDVIKKYFKLVDVLLPIKYPQYSYGVYNGYEHFCAYSDALFFADGSVVNLYGNDWGESAIIVTVDINGRQNGPNKLGYDFFELALTRAGKVIDASMTVDCLNVPEEQYLEKGCFYKKIVSDGWKMNY